MVRQILLMGAAGGVARNIVKLVLRIQSIDKLPPTEYLLGFVVTTICLAFLGAIVAYMWDDPQKTLKKAFFIGMAAPSILISFYNAVPVDQQKTIVQTGLSWVSKAYAQDGEQVALEEREKILREKEAELERKERELKEKEEALEKPEAVQQQSEEKGFWQGILEGVK
ncbi:MAG: hypothetical protein JRF30_07600 [Deltaproteobacteria bacterium]|nr:hypothetical protein [Deltaproteobacteria bacterium]MBW1794698.1 hypothetical protein [Deltaproteobacteria bacterium]MBW2330778.1 hypothetical protein [Deltaproteobacteria bacterium]